MTNATLLDRLKEAVDLESKLYPFSGRGNYIHWAGIIERHQPDGVPTSNPGMWYCLGCSSLAEGFPTSECERTHDVHWPCPEIRALAERLDVVVLP